MGQESMLVQGSPTRSQHTRQGQDLKEEGRGVEDAPAAPRTATRVLLTDEVEKARLASDEVWRAAANILGRARGEGRRRGRGGRRPDRSPPISTPARANPLSGQGQTQTGHAHCHSYNTSSVRRTHTGGQPRDLGTEREKKRGLPLLLEPSLSRRSPSSLCPP